MAYLIKVENISNVSADAGNLQTYATELDGLKEKLESVKSNINKNWQGSDDSQDLRKVNNSLDIAISNFRDILSPSISGLGSAFSGYSNALNIIINTQIGSESKDVNFKTRQIARDEEFRQDFKQAWNEADDITDYVSVIIDEGLLGGFSFGAKTGFDMVSTVFDWFGDIL